MDFALSSDGKSLPGEYTIQWNVEEGPSSVYFDLIRARPTSGPGQPGAFTATKKLLLLR